MAYHGMKQAWAGTTKLAAEMLAKHELAWTGEWCWNRSYVPQCREITARLATRGEVTEWEAVVKAIEM